MTERAKSPFFSGMAASFLAAVFVVAEHYGTALMLSLITIGLFMCAAATIIAERK